MDRPQDRLALIEVLERDGRVQRALDVMAWPLTIGRALDNHLVLDDPHVAARHARIEADAQGRLGIVAGDSVNGVRVDRRALRAGESAPLGAGATTLMLGATRLRLRLPSEELAPEKPLVHAHSLRVTVACAVALAALVVIGHAIELDPGADFTRWLPPLLAAPAALALWCAIWALASKIFRHGFDFWPHVGVALRALLVFTVLGFALPIVAASLSWEWLSRLSDPVGVGVLTAMLWLHARLVLPTRGRVLAGGLGVAYLGVTVVGMAMTHYRSDRWFNELYMSALPPPMLRLAGGVTPQKFIDEAQPLRERLEQRVRKAAREDKDNDGEALSGD
jgi:hypothetical protein